MQQIIGFIVKNGLRLLFLLLFGIALYLTIGYHSFHRSKLVNSSNRLVGFIYMNASSIKEYFSLKSENDRLQQENLLLKEYFLNHNQSKDADPRKAIVLLDKQVDVVASKVIKNVYRNQKNILTIKGGSNQGVKKDMGVITDRGIVGIVENISDNYATVLSVLNADFQIVAKLKKNNHFGTLSWNGKSTGFVQVVDIPRIATVVKGDTIVTQSDSKAFPEDTPIGIIEKIYLDKQTNSFTLDVRLFSDMTNLGRVYVVENTDRAEITELEKLTEGN
ncbi:MAG: rod shape-determining protein MreC [Bacteroidota bacterium]|nr:rod shape-determining protein MreC [Bacteroidota bacterium]